MKLTDYLNYYNYRRITRRIKGLPPATYWTEPEETDSKPFSIASFQYMSNFRIHFRLPCHIILIIDMLPEVFKNLFLRLSAGFIEKYSAQTNQEAGKIKNGKYNIKARYIIDKYEYGVIGHSDYIRGTKNN